MNSEGYHFSHPHHRFYLYNWSYTYYWRCCLCNQLITSGEEYYKCEGYCFNVVHKQCGELPEQINNHTFHDQHPLTLRIHNNNISSCCFYCDKPFGDEYAYSCEECEFYMHMRCASIPLPTLTCHDGDIIVRFSCHQHPMAIFDQDDGKDAYQGNNCFVCQLPWSTTPSYSCTTLTCKNFVHKSCAQLSQTINHPFHSHQPLKLQITKLQTCDVCCKKDCKLGFICCESGCNFKLCTKCTNLHTTVKCRSHDHSLALVENACCDHNIQCDACLRSYKGLQVPSNRANFEVQRTQSLLFRCMECTYNLHFICGPLPFMVKDDYHIHKLTLVDSLNEEEFEEYYCDSCEEERNPQFRVYTCTDCKYTAHIMKAIKGETNTNNYVESMAFGESRWDWTIYEKAKQHQHQTLQDIIKTLTLEEKHKLTYPLDFTHFKHHYNYFRNLNSQFDELGSLENFNKFKEFLQSDYDLFWRELIWYTSEEGLKVEDEKYLRQEVVEVAEGKYMVPKTLAPILTTFILKYGDVDHGKSHLTSIGMRSVIPTLLCIVIDKMCRTKLEDITMDHLKQWYFYLHGIQEISGFKLFPIRKILYGKFLRAYLGYKVIRWEEEIPKKLDTKIATLKAELERCEKMREELPAILSDKSSFKLECLRETATWKNKTPVDAIEEYYKCEGYCFNVVHKQCGELPEQINNHTFHDQHPLTLRIHNNNISSCCFYCDKPFGDEYAYSWEECEFYMHMRCVSIPLPTLTCHDGDIVRFSCHQHPMAIIDQDDGKDAYQDDYHIHKLSLVDSLNEEEFDEYYCDSCEEERNPQFRLYRCTNCKYTAYVHCMMNEYYMYIFQ
ncbi:hypothetical protein F8388_024022 [Cannabis sativa]|uniref:Phorbol-ester/DAG-type domain-containing protein n=1 Tax=Cannabis sativa TaxID=3483 RepID=A0A7J6FX85_CANSA|nr:hypothetical protein F8388_024022 [Cannabis sativa]